MRIALVIERFEARGGGVEAVAWQAAHALAAAGDEVRVLARRVGKGAGEGITPQLLPVASAWQPWRVLAFSRAAARATAAGRFDVVQSFSRTRRQDVYRTGGGCHAAYMEQQYGPAGARWRRITPRHAVLLGIEAAVFADPSQTILCNSEMVRAEIQSRFELGDERFAVIPNGVDLARFDPERAHGTAAELRRSLAPDAERVFCFVGSGWRRKGLDTALAALARRPRGEALWIAGRDEPARWKARAEGLGVADRVHFLGARDDLPEVYAASDALLLPTRYDAFANVCLEAAAMALPIVTSPTNGAAGWLGDAAIVVDGWDADAWADALGRLADDGTRARMGAAGRARAKDATWAAHAAALRALYTRIAA